KCGEIEGLFLFMYSMGRHDQIYKATRLFLRVLSLTIIRTLSDSEGVQNVILSGGKGDQY
ncbi:hypothetical protein, partial [Ekhidna sp.]|uniref:hypothetical protein n=1 Tax=Ekhidna sp. TaxID=2608089 RepID=UPI003296D131